MFCVALLPRPLPPSLPGCVPVVFCAGGCLLLLHLTADAAADAVIMVFRSCHCCCSSSSWLLLFGPFRGSCYARFRNRISIRAVRVMSAVLASWHACMHAMESQLRQVPGHSENFLHTLICCTDRGSNELACRKMVACLCKDVPNVLFLEMNCLEHGVHLVTLSGLQLMDKLLKDNGRSWKYYSSLSIIAQVLRSVAGKLFASWTASLASKPCYSVAVAVAMLRLRQLKHVEGRQVFIAKIL